MLKQTLMATAITFAAASVQSQTVLLAENFDSIRTLAGRGWVQTNLSAPIGTTSWFQGDASQFAAQAGAADAYIAANFNSAVAGGAISNWLITPTFSTAVAGAVSFWAHAVVDPEFADHLAYGFSGGSSSPAAFTLGSTITVPGAWNQYTVNYAAQGAGSTARFAIVYTGAADLSNYVGVDTLAITAVPEPSTWALMAAGLFGIVWRGRRLAGTAVAARQRRSA